jgi:hypothetical protein
MFSSAIESTMEKVGALKKNCEGFPLFFTLKNFKSAFVGDIKLWSSRHYRHRRRCSRRHRRSRSELKRKINDAKGKS